MERKRIILVNGEMTIRLPKDLDHHAAKQIRLEADRMLDMHPVERLIFDFSETEFMDSSGIGVVIGRYKRVSYMGGITMAVNIKPQVKKIFVLAGLDKIIAMKEYDEEDTYTCQ